MTSASGIAGRVVADGRHLALDGSPFRVRGVTYGSFLPRLDGEPFPERAEFKPDLADIAGAGLNTVRTYTLPPPDLLECVSDLGLRLIVGLDFADWRYEGHPGPAANRRVLDAGRRAVERAVARCAGRPDVLAISVGNEVPADVVRLHGVGAVEEGLSSLVAEVHAGDPGVLVTYTNFPTTEYLQVEGMDLACFNVFLERADALRAYLRHLQVVVGDRPLVVTELGLASAVHGEQAQSEALRWQLRLVDECGSSGATVFAWTDEWGVNGQPVEGWGFGITTAQRRPRPALDVVAAWASSRLADLRPAWPRLSVVVCAYNEEARIGGCLASLQGCDYPDLEVIVCDDGSEDATLEVARGFPFRVLELPHGGLSVARNAGVTAASGEIVAFLDADAACHPEWPYHLVLSLEDGGVVAAGGPNLPVPGVGLVERAVAASPGNPVHVLVGDDRAEHVPGCNMAFRKDALEAVGGFDPVYTAAGDDVDVCWKLLDRGQQIAFSAAAQVHHHRRSSVRGYLRQQRGYGRAERLLAARHRHRFNRLGQARWRGFIYGGQRLLPGLLRPVVYHGSTGAAPFQPIARRPAEEAAAWASALLPVTVATGAFGLGASALFLPLAGLAVTAALLCCAYAAAIAGAVQPPRSEPRVTAYRALVALLHVAQPLARAWGRARRPAASPGPGLRRKWDGDRGGWLATLERELVRRRLTVRFGHAHHAWDLEASAGLLLAARLTTAVRWGWEPAHRRSFRLRPAALAVAVICLVLAVARPGAGLALGVTGAMAATVELVVLRRAVARALRSSTARAGGEA